MQSDTYWSKRLQELDTSFSKDEKRLFSELSKYYEQEYAALDKEIAAYYAKYGEENVIAFRTLLLELPDADKQLLLQNMDEFAKQYPEFADLLPVRESIYKLNRLEGLQTSIVLQQLKIGAIEQAKFREHFEKQALKYANYAAEQLGFGTNFYRIDSEMLQVVIGNPWCNGKDFSERIWANREALAQTLQNEIANGLIRGEDYRTMSRILQQKFENTSQKQAERLVFTEDTYLSNEAKIRPFERNAAYTHYEYLCVEDHRTCETCRALSGQTFEISKRNAGLNFPPMHPWCRCTVMPVVEDLETIKSRLTSGGNDGKIEVRFETPEKMQKHYDKHIDKYGNISISEYIALANELVNAKDTDDIERIVRSDESTAIYRFSTNDFLVITKDGYIRTFFKPDDGEAYWREEHERN
jgi:SPP1 gp7 family putative phage head morphogenesis protein